MAWQKEVLEGLSAVLSSEPFINTPAYRARFNCDQFFFFTHIVCRYNYMFV